MKNIAYIPYKQRRMLSMLLIYTHNDQLKCTLRIKIIIIKKRYQNVSIRCYNITSLLLA